MLVESYRTERGPRQRVVAYLGQMDPAGRLGIQEAAEGTPRSGQKLLFESTESQWVEVDASRVHVVWEIRLRERAGGAVDVDERNVDGIPQPR